MATVLQPLHTTRKIDYGYFLYFGLHFAGFMATTLLMTWGVFVLFFLAIGSFSLDGMMNHLQNMTSRYLAADAGRLDQFKMIVGIVHMVISGAIMFFRRHAILPRDAARLEHGA
ncbi:hypothetical protein C8J46_106171 [Sphingomonas sp. PP-F2F-A104-K0414]|uniref:hypothetical protein n=1 Tax=Sphingomonas sp. PP-F2F-A104-K0414 TaxID=2135661 RepID=UPI001048F7A7|nr:hypothetical protein [Sphingomonas sp. PP-F2F-A104-K0414]TCP97547.1 hypothetical protein C8J46_106171 [Sphingomonas sp. PP-F2F-A104-K0414]